MKQGLSLRVSQHLTLTPQLQQSIRLLQLSTLELSQEVEQMLDQNPFLEKTQDEAIGEEFGLPQADTPVSAGERTLDIATNSVSASTDSTGDSSSNSDEVTPLTGDDGPDWDGDGTQDMSPDDNEWGTDATARTNNLDATEERDATEWARSHESLQAHLHRQALGLHLGQVDAAALSFLIESLNDDGYLEDSLDDLVQGLVAGADTGTGTDTQQTQQVEDLQHHFTVALRLLQSLEPSGVGARDLAECLRLQLKARLNDALAAPDPKQRMLLELALCMCEQSMDLLARRDIKALTQRCGGVDAQVREALTLIGQLEPKPGRRFVNVERNLVIPDVLVVPVTRSETDTRAGTNSQFRVMLNPDVMPRLRVHDMYANVLRNHRATSGKEGSGYTGLQQQLQEARWFIKNVQQRFDTILRVSTAIVERQKGFFTHGEMAMRPLVLREIADELGLHESTISRVTSAKYMATPFGTFELKYFFGSGLGTESGGSASSTAVRGLIKQFIAAEDANKPLSDNQISEMLKEQGIECARRTVAKYREGLKIATASLRKEL
jgi:RNA polymerase sigma-54 factor